MLTKNEKEEDSKVSKIDALIVFMSRQSPWIRHFLASQVQKVRTILVKIKGL